MSRHALCFALVVASLASGCTFYTQCPNVTSNGGSSSGGSSGNAGSGGNNGLAGGPVAGEWTDITANLEGLSTQCGTLGLISPKPDEDLLIAGVALQGMWSSQDGGGTWNPLGQGKGSDMIVNRPNGIVYDPTTPGQFWEVGTYNSGGVYETTDDGDTFVQAGTEHHNDSVSIDFTDPDRKTLLAGGHEVVQTVDRSQDGGKTWSSVGAGLPSTQQCTYTYVVDAMTYMVGCTAPSGATSIYRTADGGMSWAVAGMSGGSHAPLLGADGTTLYWATGNPNGLVISTDQGMTWSDILGSGLLRPNSPIELPDGRIAALGVTSVIASADQGVTWSAISPDFPWDDPVGVAYSAQQKALYVWHFTCDDTSTQVPAQSVMKFDLDASAM